MDAVVPLLLFFLPWKLSIHMLYPCIHVFCVLRSYGMMYYLLMYLYLLLHTLRHVQWMLLFGCAILYHLHLCIFL